PKWGVARNASRLKDWRASMKFTIAALTSIFLAATAFAATGTSGPSIIPLPQKMELRTGMFHLTSDTKIYSDSASRETAGVLVERLRTSTGCPLKVTVKSRTDAASGSILLTTKNANTNLGPEGYELDVAADVVVIRAPTQAGL